MGTKLEEFQLALELKKTSLSDFVAEVFFEEMEFILGYDLIDFIAIQNKGMNSRSLSKDVVGISVDYLSTQQSFKENIVIHLSRNSIYHQLPEVLFHPLVISDPTMSNREIVEAIRENKKAEERNVFFFRPFDTFLFQEKVRLSRRRLTPLFENNISSNLYKLIIRLLDLNFSISVDGVYKLFLGICESENFKEDFQKIESLIFLVLGLDIKLNYKKKYLKSPFESLGDGLLGVDMGVAGYSISEKDDIRATLFLSEPVSDYSILMKNIDSVRKILSFFVLVCRDIYVEYEIMNGGNFILSENHLGYDTYLS